MQLGEPRQRWTDGFDGDQIGVFRPGERDCECGANGGDVVVVAGLRRGNDTTRRLACGCCGRRWWQIDVGD